MLIRAHRVSGGLCRRPASQNPDRTVGERNFEDAIEGMLQSANANAEPVPESSADGAAAASEALPPLTGLRAWFIVFIAWLGGLTAAAVLLLRAGDQGSTLALHGWLLALMCFYLSLCNTFVPLPTAWIVLLAAAPDYAIAGNPALNILIVAALSTLSTIMANLNEYHVFAYLLHFGLGARIRRSRLYGWATRWYDRAPFQLLVLGAFIPLPDAIRWLAILRHYPRGRFALAYLLGRGPRYVLFAGASVLFALTAKQIALIQVGIILAALLVRLAWRLFQGARAPAAQPG